MSYFRPRTRTFAESSESCTDYINFEKDPVQKCARSESPCAREGRAARASMLLDVNHETEQEVLDETDLGYQAVLLADA